ncbi:ankyrin repeat protein [Verticillium dahliae]|nr:ankyrin repeat protein [Verticillium dahliae]
MYCTTLSLLLPERILPDGQIFVTLTIHYTNILVDDDFKSAFHGRHSTLLTEVGDKAGPTDTNVMVSACKRKLDSFYDDLKKRLQGHRIGWERFKIVFQARKLEEAVKSLHRQCAALNELVVLDTLALVVHVHKQVTDARKEQQGWQVDREDKAILDWITTADYSTQQSDFVRRRQAGTGQWLLDSAEYQQWIETSQRTLFCLGIPGAGKTILTSIVIDNLYIRFRDDEHVGIAFLYCNFRRQAEQKVEDLLSSLLKQLSQNHTSLPEALQTVAKIFSRTFIVVDALDECQLSDGSRHQFLTEISALQTTSRANFIATSRYTANITEMFTGSVSLGIRARAEDVQRYLKGNMAHMPACVNRSPDLQAEITTKIVEAVDGMFLLAQLHLDSLKGKRSPKAVRSALSVLHAGSQAYDLAYDDAMKRIEGQRKDEVELAKQVLSWITCAKRPLSTIELQHALGVEVGETELDLDNISQPEDIMSVCAGLVTVDEESNIIRLVHYSTQEYFMRTWKRWFADAQTEITKVCATSLSFSSFESGFCRTDADFEDRLRLHPLYDYVAHFWGDHAREAGETSPAVLGLLRNEKNVEAQVQVLWVAERFRPRGYSQRFPKRMQGLHVTAYFGLEKAGKGLLDSGDRPDMKDSYGRTSLSRAAENGREAMVKLLLDTEKVNFNSKDGDGRTPLSWAALKGNEAVVKMLLDKENVDVNSRDSQGRTPL